MASYSRSLESRIKSIVSSKSTAYWYHLVRRIGPGSLGTDQSPGTIDTIRTIINAAIQKYALVEQCQHVGSTKKVKIEQVFKGLLMADEFEYERRLLHEGPEQLVFLDFDQGNLLEYYNLEMLSYEIWKCAATNRIIAKGALLCVDLESDEKFYDVRSDELNHLVKIYDNRDHFFDSSSTGTVFNKLIDETGDYTLVPDYNADKLDAKVINPLFLSMDVCFPEEYVSNYVMKAISIKGFFHSHLPLSQDFHNKHNVLYEYVIQIIEIVSQLPIIELAIHKDSSYIGQLLRRGFQIFPKNQLMSLIKRYWSASSKVSCTDLPYNLKQIHRALDFLTLKERGSINLFNPGPVKLILPGIRKDSVIFDHSLISTFLSNLFVDLPLATHKFRGDTLENALNIGKSFLPITPCKALNRTQKQIDYSIGVGNVLIIAECKVVAKSFGIFTGDAQALKHRKDNVILKGLNQVDDKARWLSANPVGTNYNTEGFEYILPLVISPFVEFIDSFDKFFWINTQTPRVVTLKEFNQLLGQELKIDELNNLVRL